MADPVQSIVIGVFVAIGVAFVYWLVGQAVYNMELETGTDIPDFILWVLPTPLDGALEGIKILIASGVLGFGSAGGVLLRG